MRHQAGTRGCFNTQPPEGGWDGLDKRKFNAHVSTHSRLKAAGISIDRLGSDL